MKPGDLATVTLDGAFVYARAETISGSGPIHRDDVVGWLSLDEQVLVIASLARITPSRREAEIVLVLADRCLGWVDFSWLEEIR